ncbi:hypothetical protein TMatcc_004604 [Talaromyces marneffei ATCC 18224]
MDADSLARAKADRSSAAFSATMGQPPLTTARTRATTSTANYSTITLLKTCACISPHSDFQPHSSALFLPLCVILKPKKEKKRKKRKSIKNSSFAHLISSSACFVAFDPIPTVVVKSNPNIQSPDFGRIAPTSRSSYYPSSHFQSHCCITSATLIAITTEYWHVRL